MSEVKKIATRESYGKALAALGAEHEDLIVLDADLAGATKTATFQKAFPERFIDCGIAEGKIADCMLVDLDHHAMLPNYHLVSNLVYSADPSCIDTVICNGKILMRNRYVPGEEAIIAEAKATAADLLKR